MRTWVYDLGALHAEERWISRIEMFCSVETHWVSIGAGVGLDIYPPSVLSGVHIHEGDPHPGSPGAGAWRQLVLSGVSAFRFHAAAAHGLPISFGNSHCGMRGYL